MERECLDAVVVYGHVDWFRIRTIGRSTSTLTFCLRKYCNKLYIQIPIKIVNTCQDIEIYWHVASQ